LSCCFASISTPDDCWQGCCYRLHLSGGYEYPTDYPHVVLERLRHCANVMLSSMVDFDFIKQWVPFGKHCHNDNIIVFVQILIVVVYQSTNAQRIIPHQEQKQHGMVWHQLDQPSHQKTTDYRRNLLSNNCLTDITLLHFFLHLHHNTACLCAVR
jgi:hypothetical protein